MNDEVKRLWRGLVSSLGQIDSMASNRLSQVFEDIDDPRTQAELADMNLSILVDPDRIEDRAFTYYQYPSLVENGIEFLRNILVFAPIALTWFGLYRAVPHYQQVAAANPDITKPFLLLWEEGFFYELDKVMRPTFSEVALWDTVLIMIILILTGIVHLLATVRTTNASKRAHDLRAHVEQFHWEVSRLLVPMRSNQRIQESMSRLSREVGGLQTHMSGMLEQLKVERERLASLANRREREMGDLQIFSNGLQEGSKALLQYGQDLHGTYEQIQATLVSVARGAVQAQEQQQKFLREVAIMSSKADQLIDTIRMAGGSFSKGIVDLQTMISLDVDDKQIVLETAEQLGQWSAALVKGETTLRETLVSLQSGNSRILTDLQTRESAVTGSVNKIEQSLVAFSKASGHLDALQESNHTLAKQLASIAGQQGTLASSIRDAAKNVGDSTARSMNIATSLERISEQLVESVRHNERTIAQLDRLLQTLAKRVEGTEQEWHRLIQIVQDKSREEPTLRRRSPWNFFSRDR